MKKYLIVVAVAALSGCAPLISQQRAQQAQLAHDGAVGICQAVYDSDAYAPIRAQVPNNALHPTVAHLGDNRKATPEQVRVIAHIDEISKPCRDSVAAYMNAYAPAAAPYNLAMQTDINALWARLMNGEITFGQFNQARADVAAAAMEKAQYAEAQRVSQQQQLSLQQQQFFLQQQQYWNSLRQQVPQPATVNCHTMGGFTNCTRY